MNTKLNGKQNSISKNGKTITVELSNCTGNIYIRQWGGVVHLHSALTLKSNVSKLWSVYVIGRNLPEPIYSAYSPACCVDNEKSDIFYFIDDSDPGVLKLHTRGSNVAGKIVYLSFTYITKNPI